MGIPFPRGAEWRVWDLQVHTPFSALNNGFGSDFDAYAKTLFLKAIEKGVAVIGVTDYFLEDGYRRLRELQGDTARLDALIGAEIERATTVAPASDKTCESICIMMRWSRPDASSFRHYAARRRGSSY